MRIAAALALVAACAAQQQPDKKPSEPEKYRFELSAERLDAPGQRVSVPNGKLTLVAFLATWSEPDKRSIPKLEGMYRKYRDRGLVVLYVGIDDESERVLPFAREYGATFPVVWDKGHDIASRLRLETDPTYFIVDGQGVVRFVHRGYHDGDDLEMDSEINGLLR